MRPVGVHALSHQHVQDGDTHGPGGLDLGVLSGREIASTPRPASEGHGGVGQVAPSQEKSHSSRDASDQGRDKGVRKAIGKRGPCLTEEGLFLWPLNLSPGSE